MFLRLKYFVLVALTTLAIHLFSLLPATLGGVDIGGAQTSLEGLRSVTLSWLHDGSQSSQQYNHARSNPMLCTPDEISQGEWVQGPELKTADEVRAKFDYSLSGHVECDFLTQHAGDPAYNPQRFARLFETARPNLVPSREGCKMLPFDRRAYLVRILRSRGGLVLMGDSLSEHHWHVIRSLLAPDFESEDALVKLGHWQLLLNTANPEAESILREAGVTVSEPLHAIATFYRADFLLDRDELTTVFNHTGARLDFQNPPIPPWYDNFLAMLSRPFEIQGALEEPTILLGSFGPHWLNWEIGWTLEQDDFVLAYRKTLDNIETKIKNTPFPIAFYLRTTSPGQVDCEQFPQFDNSLIYPMSPIDPLKRTHNYIWFFWMNDMIRAGHPTSRDPTAFDFISSFTPDAPFPGNPPYAVTDIWHMSMKRPDSHMMPPTDCLHYCQPGVENWWQRLFWQQIMAESRNTDYYHV